MRALVLAGTLALLAGPTIADEITVAPAPGVVVEHRAADDTAITEKTVRHDADGCATKSVTKSDGDGDSVTKTKSSC